MQSLTCQWNYTYSKTFSENHDELFYASTLGIIFSCRLSILYTSGVKHTVSCCHRAACTHLWRLSSVHIRAGTANRKRLKRDSSSTGLIFVCLTLRIECVCVCASLSAENMQQVQTVKYYQYTQII